MRCKSVIILAGAAILALAPTATAASERASKPSSTIVRAIPQLPFRSAAQAGTYVGTLGAQAQTFVAIVVRGGRAAIYVCNGRRSDWFGATVRSGRIDVRSRRGTRLTGTIRPEGFSGTAAALGRSGRLLAIPARNGAGVYAGRDTRLRGRYVYRWIRIGDSVRGVSDDGSGSFKQGAAISEPGFTGTSAGTTTDTGGGSTAQPLSDLTCDELGSAFFNLAVDRAKITSKARKSAWDTARLSLIEKQQQAIANEAGSRNPPCQLLSAPADTAP